MPGYLIGSSKLRWLKSHRTAKLAPWSEERAEAGGTAATAARSEATAAKTATATSIAARVPDLRSGHPIMPPRPRTNANVENARSGRTIVQVPRRGFHPVGR